LKASHGTLQFELEEQWARWGELHRGLLQVCRLSFGVVTKGTKGLQIYLSPFFRLFIHFKTRFVTFVIFPKFQSFFHIMQNLISWTQKQRGQSLHESVSWTSYFLSLFVTFTEVSHFFYFLSMVIRLVRFHVLILVVSLVFLLCLPSSCVVRNFKLVCLFLASKGNSGLTWSISLLLCFIAFVTGDQHWWWTNRDFDANVTPCDGTGLLSLLFSAKWMQFLNCYDFLLIIVFYYWIYHSRAFSLHHNASQMHCKKM
jgi:hypothetical protein